MKKRGGINQHYICQGCKQPFGTDRIPRLLPVCGHTLCENCINQFMEEIENNKVILKCIADGKVMEFESRQLSHFPKNFAMLKTIEKRQIKSNPPKIEQLEVRTPQKVAEVQQTKQQQSETHSKSVTDKNKQEQLANQKQKEEQHLSIAQQKGSTYQICLIHSRPLEIVCLKDSVMICSNCALFGQHRNHDVKALADIKKDIISKEQEFLWVIDQKQEMEGQFNKSIEQEQINKLLLDKKEVLYKQIQQHFDKLLKRLKQQQKKLYMNLEQTIRAIEKSFVEDADKATKKFSEFKNWQRTALDHINILQGQDMDKKLMILDYDNSKSKIDPIEQGYRIIDDATKLKTETVANWNYLLNNFKIDFKTQETQAFLKLYQIKSPLLEQKVKEEKVIPPEKKQIRRQTEPLVTAYSEKNIVQEQTQYGSKNGNYHDDFLLEMEQHHTPTSYVPQLQLDVSMNLQSYNLGELPDMSKIQYKDSSFYTTPFDYNFKSTIIPKSPSAITARIQPKKKLKPVKVPPKYQKVMESLITDNLEILDFTNSELGNQDIIQILEHLKNKKVKTVKLIRCKLTDDILGELWNSMFRVVSLNLSQNLFSDRIIDSFLDNINKMPNLRTLTLSQNKINQRNVKIRIEEARKMEVTITL